MPVKICHNCGEHIVSLKAKCPKCGIVPAKTTSPVLVGLICVAALIVIAVIGVVLL